MTIENSKGTIYYGLHMVPGVAEYVDPEKGPFRVFINETTIRKMSPSFAGRPVYVEHVDEVTGDLRTLRAEADGWVVESFFNSSDGKTWTKFIVVSDEALAAIRKGYRLSNAYIPKSFTDGGLWNGVSYLKEVTSGEYEHLAIVKNPRYEESVIMTPEEFKAYNEEKTIELKKLSNSGDDKMFKIFKKTKVENSVDLEGMVVELPKTKQEVTLTKLINDYDAILNMNGYANGDHMVKVGEKDEMSVNDLVKKHIDLCNEMEAMKAKNAEGEEVENSEEQVEEVEKEVGDRGGDKSVANEEDKEKEEKMKNAKAKAERLKNAKDKIVYENEIHSISLSEDRVARGKARYGSK